MNPACQDTCCAERVTKHADDVAMRVTMPTISMPAAARKGAGHAKTRAQATSVAGSTQDLARRVRADFPILSRQVYESFPLVYLDSAATSQKPRCVMEAMTDYYMQYNSNVHRGVHALSSQATEEYETARSKVANFVNAETDREIVFTRNASEAVNLVAYSWGLDHLKEGDQVVVSVMEHHSNLVPWQIICQRTGAKLCHVGMTEDEELDLEQLEEITKSGKTKLIALAHVSNTLGCITPVEEVVKIAKNCGAKVLLDACQSVPHMPVDVQALGVDWIVASAHKMCGPTGIGFLWGRYDLLESMDPWMGGGEMIQDVYLDHSTYAEPPSRFEAGTPAICEAIGLGIACDYLTSIGMEKVHEYEKFLSTYMYEKLSDIKGVRIYGPKPPKERAALCAFNVEGIHPTDIATIMDQTTGVAIRSGHHCTQPLHRILVSDGQPFASARASAYLYTTTEDIDMFVSALLNTMSFFREVEASL